MDFSENGFLNCSANNPSEKNTREELDDWFIHVDQESLEIINPGPKEESPENELLPIERQEIEDEITECIYIEDILQKVPENLTSHELVQCECSLAYFIQMLVEGTTINKIKSLKNYDAEFSNDKLKDIISYLRWISHTSEILAKKINQLLIPYHQDSTKPHIVRSSYNFCTKYTQCKNFYSKYEIPTCKEHHYVHSILKYDTDSVIYFLQHIVNHQLTMTQEEFNDLYLSIKTICYVTRHMAKEISYIDYITKNNSEAFHRNNPTDLNRKVVTKKIPYKHPYNNKNYASEDTYRKNIQYSKPRHSRQNHFHSLPILTKGGFEKVPLVPIKKSNEISINKFSVLSNF